MLSPQTFVKKYDLLNCVQCGRCTASCPVSLKSALNIRHSVYRTLVGESSDILAQQIPLWDCTTCATCSERCPKKIKPFELLVAFRGNLIEKGRIQTTIREVLESLFKYGNPWGRIKEKRTEWTKDLKIKDFSKGEKADTLCFICCTVAYNPEAQGVAKAIAKIFESAKVDFGILGEEETCCGNEVRRMGEEGLFEVLQENNLDTFKKYQFVSQMVTLSPHCFNTFKNEYPKTDFSIIHYCQFIFRLMEQGRITLTKPLNKTVTYHDPCFLGKQNKIYDEPRKILQNIPGINFLEMDRSRERSLCCEGGGGRMWVEASGTGERLSEQRIKDAVEMGVEILATACPFCQLTLQDAVKTTGNEEKIQVKDIAELVAEAMS
ncbi:MAG: (Fe-S)-binding protein [Candidatus Edwardsbacteria bacterium]